MRTFFTLNSIYYRIFVFGTISFLLLYLYSQSSSPLTTHFGADYDMFLMGGEFLRKGELYTGNFDHKGPYLFMINALGLFISSGKWGIFILEAIYFTISLELLYKIGSVYTNSKKRIILGFVIFLLLLMLFIIEDPNSAEFWSLNFVLWPLLLISKHITSNKSIHPTKYAYIYGLCFGIIAFIRLNNTAIICGIIIGLIYLSIVKKQYANLFHNAIACFAGLITAIMPACIYFLLKGSFKEMIDCTFIFNFMYMGHDEKSSLINHIKTILPCLVLTVVAYTYDRHNKKQSLPFIIGICLFSIISIGGRFYAHYFTMITPLFFLSIVMFPHVQNSSLKSSVLLSTIIILTIIPYTGKHPVSNAIREFIRPFKIIINNEYRNAHSGDKYYIIIQKIFKNIPESSRNSIYQYELPYYFYALTYRAGNLPVGRYPSMQEDYNEIWGKDKRNDIIKQFNNAKPHYIISGKDLKNNECVIREYVSQYTCIDTIFYNKDTNKIFLYKRNDVNVLPETR